MNLYLNTTYPNDRYRSEYQGTSTTQIYVSTHSSSSSSICNPRISNNNVKYNFDGTKSSTHLLAQVYLTPKSNNKVYTLKEIIKAPDKMELVKAMQSEVSSSSFKEKI